MLYLKNLTWKEVDYKYRVIIIFDGYLKIVC